MPPAKNPARGEALPQSKLTERAVQHILDRRARRLALLEQANEHTAAAIAKDLGVHRCTVEKVLEGRTWRHTGQVA